MTISVSEYIEVEAEVFDATGALDAILDVDSKLFIDPYLLKTTAAPELQHSYTAVSTRFGQVLRLLEKADGKNFRDPFWRQARRLFAFPEVQGLCIGYAKKNTSGSGMGIQLREQVLRTAKIIVNAGITDPEIFELMGIFEEGIGADRISDMVAWIILPDLLAYSERIFAELGARTTKTKSGEQTYKLVQNHHNNWPIILLPRDILRDLPIAYTWDDIEDVSSFNMQLRNKVNQIVRLSYGKQRPTKSDLRRLFLDQTDLLEDLIKVYKSSPARRYNFDVDPSGQLIWHRKAKEFVENYPLELSLPSLPKTDDVSEVVLAICEKFKDLIENNALYTLLYDQANRPKKEEAAQKLFFGIADSYCEANNLDLSREPNAGRGSVDFKISKGYQSRVIVETKLTTNPHLQHGFETQIGEYQKAEKSRHSIYLVIDVGGSRDRIQALKDLIQLYKTKEIPMPKVIFINAHPKLSASKYKGPAQL